MGTSLFQPAVKVQPRVAPRSTCVVQSAQGQAAAADTRSLPASLSMLISTHVLQDGEVVLLAIKPSLWFIALNSLWFAGGVLVLLFATLLHLPGRTSTYIEIAVFLIAGRVMWVVLQWMGRLYVLTDMRILRFSGVFTIQIFECPLRRVARTRIIRTMRERFFRLGTIEIVPADDQAPPGYWHTIARPILVHQQIVTAINRAKQGRVPVRTG